MTSRRPDKEDREGTGAGTTERDTAIPFVEATMADTTRPNVLWIMSDQHNANACGYAGNDVVKTPHLDALAAEGISFANAYCNNPICGPSRICFITGQYVHTHGYITNRNADRSATNPNTIACTFTAVPQSAGMWFRELMQ